jgi:hypothetical protein
MTKLKIEWEDFIKEIDLIINEANGLLSSNQRGSDDEEKFYGDYNLWREKVVNYLDKSFGKIIPTLKNLKEQVVINSNFMVSKIKRQLI